MRTRWVASFVFGLVTLSIATSAFANINSFVGNWKNVDANTRGVTKLHIIKQGDTLTMQAWGQCHPQDCDWGTVPSYAYGPNVSSDLANNTEAVSAVYAPGHAEILVIVQKAPNNRIRAEVLTRFTDKSNRTNYRNVYTFERDRKLVGPPVVGPPVVGPPVVGPPVVVPTKEDCVDFNPKTATVQQINNRWKIVDGSHWMFDFGSNGGEARKSLAIIKNYQINKSCFVGRPDPSFSYLLVGNRAPQGAMGGEDCLSFNPRTATVKQINNSWKIVDGSHWMFDFGNKKSEADQSLSIIKRYGFTHSCFVGRPNPSFQYLRK